MKIKKIVVGMLNTNCYILEKGDKCLIIDPGDEEEKIRNNINKCVVGILLTHRHFDHVGVLDAISKYYGAKIYDKSNLSKGLNTIDEFEFFVNFNPGHTMDSISFIFDNFMFSGDFIFKGCIGRCDLGGDYNMMQESIRNILEVKDNYKIYPGHGEITTLDTERKMLKSYVK